jgi:hypothetical protein
MDIICGWNDAHVEFALSFFMYYEQFQWIRVKLEAGCVDLHLYGLFSRHWSVVWCR